MEFEPTITMFERAKTCHTLDRAATLIGFKPVIAPLMKLLVNKYDGKWSIKCHICVFRNKNP
jgi:hypothetical protein